MNLFASQIWNNLRDLICKLYQDGALLKKELYVVAKYSYEFSTTRTDWDETGLTGKQLYNLIDEILKQYLDDLKQTIDTIDERDILTFIVTKWKSYKEASKALNLACRHLNENWIGRKRSNADNSLDLTYKVFHLAYFNWRTKILEPFYTPTIKEALKLIENERNGFLIDSSLISDLVDCIVAVSLKPDESGDLTSYKDKFEHLFLEETERFYNKEVTNFLKDNSVTEYMKKVERRLDEEQKRLKYLHESTNDILTRTCELLLIQRHLSTFRVEFKNFLKLDQNEDMARMYSLVARNPEDLRGFADLFHTHVLQQGLSAVEKNCKSHPTDAKIYVTTILEVCEKYGTLVLNAFQNNSCFAVAFKNALTRFLNKNKIASSAESSELLAQYCGVLLRKSKRNMESSELENNLKNIMGLYNFLENKDVFEIKYFKSFVNRLLNNTSIGCDAENLMISLMVTNDVVKKYTSELTQMLEEIEKSTNLNQKFQTYLIEVHQEPVDIELNFKVLAQYLWKIKQSPIICMPGQLETYATKFIRFYANLEPKKRLHVCYNLCNGVLVTNYFRNRFTIQANSVQISVLLKFNISSHWALSELVNETKIEMGYLLPSLQALIHSQFLTCSVPERNLEPNSIISLNETYDKKKSSVNLENLVQLYTRKNEEKKEICEETRMNTIQSNIMFVLKKHQVMKHQNLIDEVSKRISLFPVSLQNFKKSIGILISKEYLERSSDSYKYLP